MPRHYYVLELRDDPDAIAEYERWHRSGNIWPEIVDSLRAAGIGELEIFRAGNRLVMAMQVPQGFSADAKAARDAADPRVQEWERLMWRFQQALPFASPGEKWVEATRIFSLRETLAARDDRT